MVLQKCHEAQEHWNRIKEIIHPTNLPESSVVTGLDTKAHRPKSKKRSSMFIKVPELIATSDARRSAEVR